MPKVSLHIRLPDQVVERIRADARRSGKTLDAVAMTVFTDFFNAWSVAERAKFYSTAEPKRRGRPQNYELAAKEAAK